MAEIGIPASLLERYFSAYGNKSPLETAITPERVQAATEKFLAAQQAQAEQKLLQANIPEGAGSMPIKSFADLMAVKKLEAEKEKKGQDLFNQQAEKVYKWKMERIKQAEDQTKAEKEWAFKIRRQEETEKHNRAMEAKKDTGGGSWKKKGVSSGTVKTDPLGIR